jgi:hypothetical protein
MTFLRKDLAKRVFDIVGAHVTIGQVLYQDALPTPTGVFPVRGISGI